MMVLYVVDEHETSFGIDSMMEEQISLFFVFVVLGGIFIRSYKMCGKTFKIYGVLTVKNYFHENFQLRQERN